MERLSKRQNGQYYTQGNPFVLAPFQSWARDVGLHSKAVLEPYAGANHIIRALRGAGYAERFISYDLHPAAPEVRQKDTLEDFPKGFDVCITNPPWLAKNSAHRRGLRYPNTQYDDLYKHALALCLDNCAFVGALIPATFLQSRLFLDRLDTVVFLHDKGMFSDTENPVCLSLFNDGSKDTKIFFDTEYIGTLRQLQKYLPPREVAEKRVVFNNPGGELGFIAFDDTRGPSIRFCRGDDIAHYTISHSSRMITRISGDFRYSVSFVRALNREIEKFREDTRDVFLTPFKGLRKDGKYRRRMDYQLARDFISVYA